MAQCPFATNNNGYDGLDTKLLFNSPLHVKHIDFLSKLQKDGVMVYVGRKSEAINAFTSGEAGILMNSSGSYAAVKAVPSSSGAWRCSPTGPT